MKSSVVKHSIVAVSTTGIYHRLKGLPCQDSYAYQKDKDKVVAVVSDGAGSAKYGKIGAKIVCETLSALLFQANISQIHQKVIDAIEIARQKLEFHRFNKTKTTAGLLDFSATLVGFFYQHGKGVFFHIGDGAAVALYVPKSKKFILSEPENGIFPSETFFYTMDDWKDSLRFTPVEKAKSVFLMTDGVTSFALNKNRSALENNFIEPINAFLLKEADNRKASRALKNTLETPRAANLNPDDKTLLWVKL